MAGMAGFEPTTFGFGDRRSTTELHPYLTSLNKKDFQISFPKIAYLKSLINFKKMVPKAGIEPATRRFSVYCSTD